MKRRKQSVLSRDEISITREAEYIIGTAQQHDPRVVRLGSLILFSTASGDAWILDPDDQLALCLARGGERQQFSVLETADSFRIGWNAHYAIADDVFSVATGDGRVRSIMGYPTSEIQKR